MLPELEYVEGVTKTSQNRGRKEGISDKREEKTNNVATVIKCLNSFLAFVVSILFPATPMSLLGSPSCDIVNGTTVGTLLNTNHISARIDLQLGVYTTACFCRDWQVVGVLPEGFA